MPKRLGPAHLWGRGPSPSLTPPTHEPHTQAHQPVGKRPQNTLGMTSVYPGRASAAGCFLSVMVSPTRASATCLMEAARYPTSPAYRESTCSAVPWRQYHGGSTMGGSTYEEVQVSN